MEVGSLSCEVSGCISSHLKHDFLTRDNVLLGAEQVTDGFLLDVWEIFVELVGKGKCYDRQPGVVSFACSAFFILLLALFVFEVALLAVNVADTTVPALLSAFSNLHIIYEHAPVVLPYAPAPCSVNEHWPMCFP